MSLESRVEELEAKLKARLAPDLRAMVDRSEVIRKALRGEVLTRQEEALLDSPAVVAVRQAVLNAAQLRQFVGQRSERQQALPEPLLPAQPHSDASDEPEAPAPSQADAIVDDLPARAPADRLSGFRDVDRDWLGDLRNR